MPTLQIPTRLPPLSQPLMAVTGATVLGLPGVSHRGMEGSIPHFTDQAQRADPLPADTTANWKSGREPQARLPPHGRAPASVPGYCAKGFTADSLDPLSHHVTILMAQRAKLRPREIRCHSKATQAEPILTLRMSDSNDHCHWLDPPKSRCLGELRGP